MSKMCKMCKMNNRAGNWIAMTVVALLIGRGLAVSALADESTRYDTPEAAVAALMEATKTGDKAALQKIFGTTAGELCSGDEVQDKADVITFAKRLAAAHKLVKNENGTMTLTVGRNGHPFPVPLTQKDGKWFFDTAAGKEEILNRRIGDNELRTLATCRGYVVAQREYFEEDRDGDEVLEYAQLARSTPGKKDGLYWETAEGEPPSPLGPLAAEARAEGYGAKQDEKKADNGPRPYHGYLFKILKKQGGESPGGKFDYVVNGNMVAGFALVAWPVEYGNSGIMTFIVNSNGVVYQKDLGENTSKIASEMESYDRDASWKVAED